ncbi:MAG: hypothetical protein L6416_12820 [Candidatus Omnitrophica bacterium]|nr:hypothetical protein [Candidatus Omnitrophota bacterium]
MKLFTSQKGTILVAAYLVMFVIIVMTAAFFSLAINNNKAVAKANDGAKALNYAEKGIAYAYHEWYKAGWEWYTHRWNPPENNLIKITPVERTKTRDDCYFDPSTGFYVHNSGEFMVKAYPDYTRGDDTVVLAMGICGSEKKVIMKYFSSRGIYDFFMYTPYDLDLYNAVGHHTKLNGGAIHSNGDIYFDSYMRLENISELSAGGDGNIYYSSEQYPAPYYADNYDGIMDGKAPITRLDNLIDVFRDDSLDPRQPGPFGEYASDNKWDWKDEADEFVEKEWKYWPTKAFCNTHDHFYGSSLSIYDIASGDWDNVSDSYNDNSESLNDYNVWIKPYKVDADGEPIETVWEQIPGKLNQEWTWDKYYGDSYGSGDAAEEQPITFFTYKDDGSEVDVADTYWEIDASNEVVMLDPPIGGTAAEWAAFNLAHPQAKQYWDMFKTPEFWDSVRGDSDQSLYFNDEVADGTYGDERSGGGTIQVEHTNSLQQPAAWSNFLKNTGLAGIVRDANTGGKYLDPPDFSETYSKLAEKDGILIDLDAGFDGEFSDYDEWQEVLEKSIDTAADVLNKGDPNGVAKKVNFINTFTGKWNVVLEIDLEKMQNLGVYPNNGILYSKVPVRFTNAKKLARAQPKFGFTVLGEENIYLKGDYNTEDWVTSAVISKKRVFTLSDDFNDPQVKPAPNNYPNYPYLYVKDDGFGNYEEIPYAKGGGEWVVTWYLDDDGAVDKEDYYPHISDTNEASLRSIIYTKNDEYCELFYQDDPSGEVEKTWTWAPTGETFTAGMMPNKVRQDQTYNCMIASNRFLEDYDHNRGSILENWNYEDEDENYFSYYRILNGGYFVLDDAGFTAHDEFIDDRYSGLEYDGRGREAPGSLYWNSYYLYGYWPDTDISYDARFKTATRSPSDVFFGGAESLWHEESEAFFYQTKF